MHKVITFGIPSYNAAKDMDHCITSILEGSNYATDIEIIVVDDGSKDETAAKADEWEARYPGIIRAVHQENGGHGIAVLSGLREAQGTYYKVVDSDDWLDGAALSTMLSILRGFEERDQRVDLFISNYVYEKVYEGTHTAIGYKFALPRKKIDLFFFSIPVDKKTVQTDSRHTAILLSYRMVRDRSTISAGAMYCRRPFCRMKRLLPLNAWERTEVKRQNRFSSSTT